MWTLCLTIYAFFLQSDIRPERNDTRQVAKITDNLLESLGSVAVEVIITMFGLIRNNLKRFDAATAEKNVHTLRHAVLWYYGMLWYFQSVSLRLHLFDLLSVNDLVCVYVCLSLKKGSSFNQTENNKMFWSQTYSGSDVWNKTFNRGLSCYCLWTRFHNARFSSVSTSLWGLRLCPKWRTTILHRRRKAVR